MSAPPYMKLYVADYLGDTHSLSVVEHGAYLLLLMGMWRAGGKLPADDAKLAKVARCTPEQWAEVRDTVLPFFRRRGGQLAHKRLAEEMAKYETVATRRREASEKGVSAKKQKNNKLAEPNGSPSADQLVAKPEPYPEPKESPQPPKGAEQLELVPAEPSAPDDVRQAFDLWNETAERCGLPIAKDLSDARRRAMRKRLETGGLARWREALAAVEASAFLRGQRAGSDGRKFRADLDFVLQAKSFGRLVEGFYGRDAKPVATVAPIPVDPLEVWRRRVREFKANGYWNTTDWDRPPGREGCTVPSEVLSEFGFPSSASRSAA